MLEFWTNDHMVAYVGLGIVYYHWGMAIWELGEHMNEPQYTSENNQTRLSLVEKNIWIIIRPFFGDLVTTDCPRRKEGDEICMVCTCNEAKLGRKEKGRKRRKRGNSDMSEISLELLSSFPARAMTASELKLVSCVQTT